MFTTKICTTLLMCNKGGHRLERTCFSLFFMATLHVGKSTPLSQLYEARPLVSACCPKPQKSKGDVVRGGEKEKDREKPSKELDGCENERWRGASRTVPHEATWVCSVIVAWQWMVTINFEITTLEWKNNVALHSSWMCLNSNKLFQESWPSDCRRRKQDFTVTF